MEEFNEARYFESYKRVRNKFRNYDSWLLIRNCIEHLHRPTQTKLDQLKKHPWLVFLLIKWVLLDEQSSMPRKKIPTNFELGQVLQSIHDLGECIRLPNQFDHLRLFFRNIAFQQFIYQREFSLGHLSRQIALFSELPESHLIRTQFKSLTGVDVKIFLELSLALLTYFVVETDRSIPGRLFAISEKWFENIRSQYSIQEINSFLSALSKSPDEIKTILRERDNGRRPASEYYEQTPFIEFPLMRIETQYICIDPHILYRCIENIVYDKLRQWDSEKFMSRFGKLFESYVERAIRYTGLPYFNEGDIKSILGCSGNLIDFVVIDGDANIFIDAKAVEMAYLGKVSHLADVVRDKTESSIIKAIAQANDVMVRMQDAELNGSGLKNKDKNYLIVITFKELYVGNGLTFYEAIAKNKIDEIYARYAGKQTIDLRNMYFFSVDEFEIFAEAINKQKIGFAEGIEKAKSDDTDPKTMKF